MWFLKLLTQLFTGFGLLFIGVVYIDSDWGIGWILFYWFLYVVINIIVVFWRMADPGYDAKSDVKHAFKIAKKCPHCMKKLPSYFTSKCPHCTADL